MKKLFYPAVILLLLSACGNLKYHNEEHYNPQTQQLEKVTYLPYYQLTTQLLPEKLELSLLGELDKKKYSALYRAKEQTRRLRPNDYMSQSEVFLTLKNLTAQSISIELVAISIEHERLPLSAKILTIAANESLSLPLGEVSLDMRKVHLMTRVEYLADRHEEKTFDMTRVVKGSESKPATEPPEQTKTETIVTTKADENNSENVSSNSSESTEETPITETISNWFKEMSDSISDSIFD